MLNTQSEADGWLKVESNFIYWFLEIISYAQGSFLAGLRDHLGCRIEPGMVTTKSILPCIFSNESSDEKKSFFPQL